MFDWAAGPPRFPMERSGCTGPSISSRAGYSPLTSERALLPNTGRHGHGRRLVAKPVHNRENMWPRHALCTWSPVMDSGTGLTFGVPDFSSTAVLPSRRALNAYAFVDTSRNCPPTSMHWQSSSLDSTPSCRASATEGLVVLTPRRS